MKGITLLFLLLQIAFPTIAERIDGPANVRTGPKGTPILSLNDNVEVDCSQILNGWYTIAISIKISKEQYESNVPIAEGDSLFNWQSEFIGIALAPIPDSLKSIWSSGGAPGNPKRYGMEVFASTYKTNIKPESIPEKRLGIIMDVNEKVVKSDLTRFLTDFEFKKIELLSKLNSQYEEYMIYESTIDDPSPMDRIRLIFDDLTLVAIIHTRPLENVSKSLPLTRGRQIIVLQQMTQVDLERFIQLNRKAYNGMD